MPPSLSRTVRHHHQRDSVPRSLFNTAFGIYPSTLDSLPPITLTMTHPVLEVLDGGVTPDTTHTARATATGPISPAEGFGASTSSTAAPKDTSTSPSNEARAEGWETLPPEYETLRPSPSSLRDSEESTNSPNTHLVKQQEKQALKEAWAQQNLSPIAPSEKSLPTVEATHDRQPSPLFLGDRRISSTVSANESLGERVLPQGMDIREALEKCDDPALGWSLQFWVTIADPIVRHRPPLTLCTLSPGASGQTGVWESAPRPGLTTDTASVFCVSREWYVE